MAYLANATYAILPDNTPVIYRTLNVSGGVVKYNGTTIPSSAYTPLNGYIPQDGDNIAAVYLDGVYVMLGTTNASGSVGGVKKGLASASIPANQVQSAATPLVFPVSFGYVPVVVATAYGTSNVGVRISGINMNQFNFVVFRTDASLAPGTYTVQISWLAA